MGYRNALPFEEAELRVWLESEYNVVVEQLTVQSGYMGTVVFVDTSTERYVLKCVPNAEGLRERLLAQTVLLDHLKVEGVPVATCVIARNQNLIFVVDDNLLFMSTFLVGDGFVPQFRPQITAAGRTLGRLHRVALNWQNMGDTIPSLGWSGWVSQLKFEWGILASSCVEGRALVNCLEGALEQWVVPRETERSIVIHNDFRAQNLVFKDHVVSGVFDFDAVCLAPRIFDVAYSLIFFQAVVADHPFDESEMCDFYRAYQQEFPIELDAQSDLSAWLGLALLRGLTLWGRIAYVDCVNLKPKVWIARYLPLLERIDQIATKLQSTSAG
ncbi:MAG: phosphotransferase [Candidatus Latescibacteria bacterium]|jgi:Ser/Thr protein kinase RdoA (MazF antagonist)|nr:phosphotransferase [Candidatus Latescibacterota bacterium]MBT4138188.1 phosphotransferase [Candidatus Latescibacterota bacterium]